MIAGSDRRSQHSGRRARTGIIVLSDHDGRDTVDSVLQCASHACRIECDYQEARNIQQVSSRKNAIEGSMDSVQREEATR